jgi:hypothetical protein
MPFHKFVNYGKKNLLSLDDQTEPFMKKLLLALVWLTLLISCKKTTTSSLGGNQNDTTTTLNNGLVAYYAFSNGLAIDSTSNHLDGTIHGNVAPTTDRFGKPNSAMYFNGSPVYTDTLSVSPYDDMDADSSSFIQVPDNSLLRFATKNELSISLWSKIVLNPRIARSLTYNYNTQLIAISKTDSFTSNQNGFEVGLIGTEVPNYVTGAGAIFTGVSAGLITNDNDIITQTPISSTYAGIDTNWHHFVFITSANFAKTYVDGIVVDSTGGTDLFDNTNPLLIGKANPDLRHDIDYMEPDNIYNYISGFTGYLDDIRIYNRTLTPTEVVALYHLSN